MKSLIEQVCEIDQEEGCDDAGEYGDIQFYSPTMLVTLSPTLKTGDKPAVLVFMFSTSKLQVMEKDGTILEEFNMQLSFTTPTE